MSDDEGRTWKVISEEVRKHCECLADKMCAFLDQKAGRDDKK
ncbi:hypothetical protein [Bartonella florencae]|nr:hypothetical protein [Bartonella florencae]